MPTTVAVTTYHLELTSRAQLRPVKAPIVGLSLESRPDLNAELYRKVGRAWNWTDREIWSPSDWSNHISRSGVDTRALMAWDEVAGYAELDRTCVENVEIVFFGLMPEFIGKGLGSYLLTAVVEHAWDVGAERVWLHTCTLDHPAALPNYLARGFRLFRTEQSFEEMDITVTSARTLERKL